MKLPTMQFYATQFPPNRLDRGKFFQNKTLHHKAGCSGEFSQQNWFKITVFSKENRKELSNYKKFTTVEGFKEFLKACLVQVCFGYMVSWQTAHVFLIQDSQATKPDETMAHQRENNAEINNNTVHEFINVNNHQDDQNANEFNRRQVIRDVSAELRRIGDELESEYENRSRQQCEGEGIRNASE